MKVLTILLFAALQPGLQEPAPAPSARPAKAAVPCASPVHRQFDFWVGRWDVVDATGKFAGTNRIERVGDCFLQETWASASGGYTGRSLNSVGFDGRWHQTWTDTSGLRLELAGGLIEGRMVLEGTTPAADPGKRAPLSTVSPGARKVRGWCDSTGRPRPTEAGRGRLRSMAATTRRPRLRSNFPGSSAASPGRGSDRVP